MDASAVLHSADPFRSADPSRNNHGKYRRLALPWGARNKPGSSPSRRGPHSIQIPSSSEVLPELLWPVIRLTHFRSFSSSDRKPRKFSSVSSVIIVSIVGNGNLPGHFHAFSGRRRRSFKQECARRGQICKVSKRAASGPG